MIQFACLMYHYLSGCRYGDAPDSQYTIPLQAFRLHLEFLKSEGFVVEDFAGLQSRIRGRGVWPERYAVLTFDDGCRTNLAAVEALSMFGFRATFFVITGASAAPCRAFLSEREIRDVIGAGHSVGTHGVTHTPLTALPDSSLIEELSGSKKWLEDVTGRPVEFTSAPEGYLTGRVLKECFRQNYKLVGNSVEWPNSAGLSAPREINRVCMRRSFGLKTMSRIASCSKSFYTRRRVRNSVLAIPKALLSEKFIARFSR
jgi:peptidoglycan/xylan/chitin deacetylase (PgdA/CDA1 family)